jgi:6-pyruvoyltetrahydropterin/6-carboxytetrahydropterin synthase
MVIDLGILDRMLDVEVRQRFDHRNINVDVVEFGEGRLVPTGENLARFIYERIAAALRTANATARVVKVTVAEDATLSASYSED